MVGSLEVEWRLFCQPKNCIDVWLNVSYRLQHSEPDSFVGVETPLLSFIAAHDLVKGESPRPASRLWASQIGVGVECHSVISG